MGKQKMQKDTNSHVNDIFSLFCTCFLVIYVAYANILLKVSSLLRQHEEKFHPKIHLCVG